MKQDQYDFQIVFIELEKAKAEIENFDQSDLDLSLNINQQIEEMKQFVDPTSPQIATYTRAS